MFIICSLGDLVKEMRLDKPAFGEVKLVRSLKILALAQSLEMLLSKTYLASADLLNRRCRMSANSSFLSMEKLRFVLLMDEKSQSMQGI